MGGGLNIVPNNTNEEEGKEYEEGDDISDSEMNQYKEVIYKLLKFRTCRIKSPNGELRCPFCVGVEKQEYHRLLEHSIRVGEGSTESGKQRASHFAMAKYLVIDLQCEDKTKEKEIALSKTKEDAGSSTVAKFHEVEKTCLQLQQNLQSMEEKMNESRVLLQKSLDKSYASCCPSKIRPEVGLLDLQEFPTPSKFIPPLSGIEKHQKEVSLSNSDAVTQDSKDQQSNDESQEVHIDLIKSDWRNNQMAGKLKEVAENYPGLVEKLKDKEIAFAHLEDLHQQLVFKERQSNDELEEIRTELIKMLSDPLSRRHIDLSFGVKGRMGEIYEKALKDACQKRYPFRDAELKLIELESQAFEIIVDDKGNPQGLLMRSDEKLLGLKADMGEEICNLLFERPKYLSGDYMEAELWNFGENRKATLMEVIHYISSLLKTQNEKRLGYGVF